MARSRFSLNRRDEAMLASVGRTDHRTLGIWAGECAARVLPYFEDDFPADPRPRQALKILQAWVETGEFSMTAIRGASLDAHAAAREVGEDSPARSAARAAGQAVATAHVATHAPGAAAYAQQAVHRAATDAEAARLIAAERDWQYRRLLELGDRSADVH